MVGAQVQGPDEQILGDLEIGVGGQLTSLDCPQEHPAAGVASGLQRAFGEQRG
jgi:hypothetical protein